MAALAEAYPGKGLCREAVNMTGDQLRLRFIDEMADLIEGGQPT